MYVYDLVWDCIAPTKIRQKKERQWDNNIKNISYDTIQYLITKKRKQTCKYVMKEM